MNGEVKADCFAYRDGECSILRVKDCSGCNFYKIVGTQCDTCSKKGKPTCDHCRR